jgi:hypothetical protein
MTDNLELLKQTLQQLKTGKVKIVIEVESDTLTKAKKRFFAMISELAREAGYHSREDREMFKEQIKQQLGNESISEMTEVFQVSTKIEELHKLALEFYEYKFPSNDSDIIIFSD